MKQPHQQRLAQHGAFTFIFDQRTDDVSLIVSFWPEGVPEVRVGGDRLSLLGGSSEN